MLMMQRKRCLKPTWSICQTEKKINHIENLFQRNVLLQFVHQSVMSDLMDCTNTHQ